MKRNDGIPWEEDWVFILNLTRFLAEIGVTDIYLSVGSPLSVRYRTEVKPVSRAIEEYLATNPEDGGLPADVREGLRQLLPTLKTGGPLLAQAYINYIAKNLRELQKVDPSYILPLLRNRAMDIGMALDGGYRARVHAFFSLSRHEAEAPLAEERGVFLSDEEWFALVSQVRFVIRIIPPIPRRIEELGLHPAVESQFLSQKGLYLITGPTASGKSTTAAYLVSKAASQMPWHILSLEDPIEYLIPSGIALGQGALVHQRERGKDFFSFPQAMMQALRESPDLIFVGEIRDEETLNWAIFLAEAGFTVLTTYHTASFPETIYRIVSSFPEEQRSLVQGRLARVLRAVISQRLIRGRTGMRLIYEYVPVDGSLSKAIGDGNYRQYSTPYTWNRSIDALVEGGQITREEAITLRAMVGSPEGVAQPRGGIFRREGV